MICGEGALGIFVLLWLGFFARRDDSALAHSGKTMGPQMNADKRG